MKVVLSYRKILGSSSLKSINPRFSSVKKPDPPKIPSSSVGTAPGEDPAPTGLKDDLVKERIAAARGAMKQYLEGMKSTSFYSR